MIDALLSATEFSGATLLVMTGICFAAGLVRGDGGRPRGDLPPGCSWKCWAGRSGSLSSCCKWLSSRASAFVGVGAY